MLSKQNFFCVLKALSSTFHDSYALHFPSFTFQRQRLFPIVLSGSPTLQIQFLYLHGRLSVLGVWWSHWPVSGLPP